MNQKVAHDAAVAITQALIESAGPSLGYEGRLRAIGDFYIICKLGIEAYEIELNRMWRCLKYSDN